MLLLYLSEYLYSLREREKNIVYDQKKKKKWPESSAFEKPKFKLLKLKIIVYLGIQKNIFLKLH